MHGPRVQRLYPRVTAHVRASAPRPDAIVLAFVTVLLVCARRALRFRERSLRFSVTRSDGRVGVISACRIFSLSVCGLIFYSISLPRGQPIARASILRVVASEILVGDTRFLYSVRPYSAIYRRVCAPGAETCFLCILHDGFLCLVAEFMLPVPASCFRTDRRWLLASHSFLAYVWQRCPIGVVCSRFPARALLAGPTAKSCAAGDLHIVCRALFRLFFAPQ